MKDILAKIDRVLTTMVNDDKSEPETEARARLAQRMALLGEIREEAEVLTRASSVLSASYFRRAYNEMLRDRS